MEKRNTKEHAETKVVANCDQLANTEDTTLQSIQNRILTIRGKQVMLDRDLAVLYGVETRTLNQAVKRNIERFPEDFMFKLSKDEYNYWKSQTTTYNSSLKSQFVTSKTTLQSNGYSKNNSLKSQIVISNKGGDRSIPYAFTDNGVAMLSSVLRSKEAIAINIMIMRAFNAMRCFMTNNNQLFHRMETMEFNQLEMRQQFALSDKRHEANEQILSDLLHRFDEGKAIPTQGIFYNGQIFDAYVFVNDLIRKARKRIVLIDNYIDDTILERLDKRNVDVKATIYTRNISKQLNIDITAHNRQYAPVEVLTTNSTHDRFLIIDDEVYLIGASIKDLGKKIFGFTKLEETASELLKRL